MKNFVLFVTNRKCVDVGAFVGPVTSSSPYRLSLEGNVFIYWFYSFWVGLWQIWLRGRLHDVVSVKLHQPRSSLVKFAGVLSGQSCGCLQWWRGLLGSYGKVCWRPPDFLFSRWRCLSRVNHLCAGQLASAFMTVVALVPVAWAPVEQLWSQGLECGLFLSNSSSGVWSAGQHRTVLEMQMHVDRLWTWGLKCGCLWKSHNDGVKAYIVLVRGTPGLGAE